MYRCSHFSQETRNDPDFLQFLLFCSERLKQGQEVQEIWEAWNVQESMAVN